MTTVEIQKIKRQQKSITILKWSWLFLNVTYISIYISLLLTSSFLEDSSGFIFSIIFVPTIINVVFTVITWTMTRKFFKNVNAFIENSDNSTFDLELLKLLTKRTKNKYTLKEIAFGYDDDDSYLLVIWFLMVISKYFDFNKLENNKKSYRNILTIIISLIPFSPFLFVTSYRTNYFVKALENYHSSSTEKQIELTKLLGAGSLKRLAKA